MVKRKLKRLLVPSFWKIRKKQFTWVVSPSPGPHKKLECIPLLVLIRDLLNLVDTGREAKSIIKKGEILVDGRKRRDHGYPLGLFDVVYVPRIDEAYRIVATKNGLAVVKVDKKEKDLKILKIENKHLIKKGKVQLNLHDGKNILVKDGSKFKTGDSILVKLPSLEIVKHLPLEKGMLGIAIKGKNAGKIGKVVNIFPGKFKVKPKVVLNIDGKDSEVFKEYLFIVGKEAPEITVVA